MWALGAREALPKGRGLIGDLKDREDQPGRDRGGRGESVPSKGPEAGLSLACRGAERRLVWLECGGHEVW